jgi:hypothetical protein
MKITAENILRFWQIYILEIAISNMKKMAIISKIVAVNDRTFYGAKNNE